MNSAIIMLFPLQTRKKQHDYHVYLCPASLQAGLAGITLMFN